MAVLARIGGTLPWWAKIAAKIVLARLPLGGRAWQSLGLFSPGGMQDPEYAAAVFETHFSAAGRPGPGFAFLELGPGDSVASAVVGRAHGAARSWLVDSGAYASRDMGFYRRLVESLEAHHPDADLTPCKAAPDVPALLVAAGTTYLEEGLASLREVPDASCDFAFSQAVLEHVPKAEFVETVSELHRILKPGGVSTHQVDFRDHLGGGLNNLRFSERLWEAPWFARRSGFYTNRLRLSQMVTLMEEAGFAVTVEQTSRWKDCSLMRRHLAPPFQALSEPDRLTWEAFLVLRKKRSSTR